MWKYYRQIFGEAVMSMLTKGPLIMGALKCFMIFGLPAIIGTIAVDNIWTLNGFKSNWPWLVGPLFGVVFLFWAYEVLNVNFKNVEKVQPNLIIDYKEGEQSYQQTEPNQRLLHRIRVFNDGEKPSKNLMVQIDTISPGPTGGVRGLPMKMHIMGRDAESDRNQIRFDLDGKGDEFIDVITLSRRGTAINYFLHPVGSYPSNQVIVMMDQDKYRLSISVFADGRKYCTKAYELEPVTDQKQPYRHRFLEV